MFDGWHASLWWQEAGLVFIWPIFVAVDTDTDGDGGLSPHAQATRF
jgi:hypothetical protein